MKKIFLIIISVITAAFGGAAAMDVKRVRDVESKRQLSEKHLRMFKMMNRWVQIKQDDRNVADYFKRNGYKKIIVYGVHYIGKTLIEELKNTDIEIVCGIDKNDYVLSEKIMLINKTDKIPDTDIIVVTAIAEFDKIEDELKQLVNCPIVSLEDILYAL